MLKSPHKKFVTEDILEITRTLQQIKITQIAKYIEKLLKCPNIVGLGLDIERQTGATTEL